MHGVVPLLICFENYQMRCEDQPFHKLSPFIPTRVVTTCMGIFSLNLEETLLLVANTEDKELVDKKFSKYIIG